MSSERSRRIALLEQRMSKDLGLHDPDPEERGPGLYNGIGDVLRQARERRDVSLPDVASQLRISESYLSAIERGRFDQLPGRSYVLGFLRSYAAFLGLNAEKVVAQYKIEADDEFTRKQHLKFPTVRPEGRTPGLWLLPLVMIIAALGYLAWYGWKTDLVSFDDMVPEVPARLLGDRDAQPAAEVADHSAADRGSPASGPRPDAQTRAAQTPADRTPSGQAPSSRPQDAAATGEIGVDRQQAEPTIGPDSTEEPAPLSSGSVADGPDSPPPLPSDPPSTGRESADAGDNLSGGAATGPDRRVPEPGSQATTTLEPAAPASDGQAAAAAGPAPDSRAFGTEDARVVLRASADTWVQVEDAQHNLLLTRLLKAGDSYRAPNQRGLILMTGNAGGLVVEVDGTPVPALGPQGAVRRNVSLDPERLVDGSQAVN